MKSFLIIMGVLCLGIATVVVYLDLKTPASSSADVETATAQSSASLEKIQNISSTDPLAKPVTPHTFQATTHRSASSYPVDPAARALKEAIEQITSPNFAFQHKQAVWKQLIADGRLDDAIEALKEGATNNPDSADYQAQLGEANLKKAGVVSHNGGSINEQGILGMTADQNFDAALKIDPSNWDAQFFKAVSMSYWPAELNKGDEVVQRLSGLINQQDTQTTRPEFSLPYIALGQEYQKLGQPDNALQAWQAGAAKFPNDPALQQKLASLTISH